MTLAEILSLFSTVAASVAAVVAFLGREAVSALQKQHDSDLRRLEESHKSELAKQTEDFKRALQYFGSVDTELRSLRIAAYSELWQRTRVLPKWPADESATYDKLFTFAEHLRDWYYGDRNGPPGGMLLTEDAAVAYRKLQSAISDVRAGKNPTRKIDPTDYETVRSTASSLRTELTRDLLSRREPPGSTAQAAPLKPTPQPTPQPPQQPMKKAP